MTSLEELENVQIKSPIEVDEDGFTTIWNFAAASCEDDLDRTRAFAAQLLGFLCKKKCNFVVVSTTDAEYLDQWFEKDTKLLYDWNLDSEKVDILAQHATVPSEALRLFLENNKFNAKTKHSPKRSDRLEWFTNHWNVG